MEIEYSRLMNMTWREYDYCSTGYIRRVERGWDFTRHMIASMFNSSGFSKKKVDAKEIMKLPHLDIMNMTFKRIPEKRVQQLLKYMTDAQRS